MADDEDDADDVEEDFDAVIISSSVAAAVIGDEYEDVEVPVMVMDAATYAEMNMTDDQNNVDFGVNNAVQELEVVEENHPLMEAINADEEDEIEISNDNIAVAFGNPDNDAEEIAEVPDQNNQVAIFEYEAGSDLVNDQEAEEIASGSSSRRRTSTTSTVTVKTSSRRRSCTSHRRRRGLDTAGPRAEAPYEKPGSVSDPGFSLFGAPPRQVFCGSWAKVGGLAVLEPASHAQRRGR